MSTKVFISHATANNDYVKQLRIKLEAHGVITWVDSRQLAAGDKLKSKIKQAIKKSDNLIAVISVKALSAKWVKREIKFALKHNIKVIPIFLDGLEYECIEHLFDQEPLCLFAGESIAGEGISATATLDEQMPAILAACGLALPNDTQPPTTIKAPAIDEMVLELSFKAFTTIENEQRVRASANLKIFWANNSDPSCSLPFIFTAPFGQDAIDDIRWYVETYYQWPTGVFKKRANEIENNLTVWGNALHQAIFDFESTKKLVAAWWEKSTNRKFSVQVASAPPEGSDDDFTNAFNRGSTTLLSLPWEIISNNKGFWFDGANGVAIRRRLPKYDDKRAITTSLPIRVLLLSPRPEQTDKGKPVGYFDHRTSAKALLDAMDKLGDASIQVTLLNPPTFAQLKHSLNEAKKAGRPFHVVHFDGHGTYNDKVGLGGLCFEQPQPKDKPLQKRRLDLVYADKLAEQMQHFGVPLFFLDACQSAMMQTDPQASVATRLLESGVGAVVAMSYSVLVATAKCFVQPFYQALAKGKTVGDAVLTGQQALFDYKFRFNVSGAGKLELHDWLVPVLYQEQRDARLFEQLPSDAVATQIVDSKQQRFNKLPAPPEHQFVGRSYQLLAFERLLELHQQLVIKAGGGFGKTAIAIELCRWLVQIGTFRQVVFIDIEDCYINASAAQNFDYILQVIGRQLDNNYSVDNDSIDKALQPIFRALNDDPVIFLLDNMETVLPDKDSNQLAGIEKLLALCKRLLAHNKQTRMIFTSRETLPAPFDGGAYNCALAELHYKEAIELVEKVMSYHGWQPPENDDATTPEQIKQLVEAVNCHPRALVLLAREVAQEAGNKCGHKSAGGVKQTTINIQQLMSKLHQQNPNDRENSLYASVELSLRRLPEGIRKQLSPLQVFHAGGQLGVLKFLMQIEDEQLVQIVQSLIDVGLAKVLKHYYIRLDPALSNYLALTPDAELARYQQRWQQAIMGLVHELYSEIGKNGLLAMQLCTLELPNIMAIVEQLNQQISQQINQANNNEQVESIEGEYLENICDFANKTEQLIQKLGRQQLLAKVITLREKSAKSLTTQTNTWSNSQFNNQKAEIERLMASGQLQAAFSKAQALLQQSLKAGDTAYNVAAFDIAMAHVLLGRLLRMAAQPTQALPLLIEAERKFNDFTNRSDISKSHKDSAAHMKSVCITDQADCLRDLGQYQQSVIKYQLVINLAKVRKDNRSQAVNLSQLATSFSKLQQYQDALESYQQALTIFEQLNEPQSLAATHHHIANVYYEIGQFSAAEKSYRQSLDIKASINDLSGQANSLTNLGALYDDKLNKPQQALDFYQQALKIRKKQNDQKGLGDIYHNIANTLLTLKKYTEAKTAIHLALEHKLPIGIVASPWTSYELVRRITLALSETNTATNTTVSTTVSKKSTTTPNQPSTTTALNTEAKNAWLQARDWYLAYRRQGGHWQSYSGELAEQVYQALTTNKEESGENNDQATQLILEQKPKQEPEQTPSPIQQQALQQLTQGLQLLIDDKQVPEWFKLFTKQLILIVNGSRDKTLVDDDELEFYCATEILWLIERLEPQQGQPTNLNC